jgi:two-component system LytT family sensor kinase
VSLRQLRFAERHIEGVEWQAGRVMLPYHAGVNLLVLPSAAWDLVVAAQTRRRGPTWAPGELQAAILWLLVGSALAVAVFRLVPRVVPWPRPFRWRFAAFHVVAAPMAAGLWFLIAYPLEASLGWGASGLSASKRFEETLAIGSFFYVLVASLAYSAHGAARAAHAEAVAAQTQLATLRSQLQPHFLFNALHTIVQLIQIDPRRAAEAAELVAELLRRTLEEQRDEVPLREEWRFVSRYLAVEQMRFGERLTVTADLPPDLEAERVPSFALQTLVENAVQHGAAPRVAPTEITITPARSSADLVIAVRNSGDGDTPRAVGTGTGTGLARLRERLAVLYGNAATLVSGPTAAGGYEAVLTVPRNRPSDT